MKAIHRLALAAILLLAPHSAAAQTVSILAPSGTQVFAIALPATQPNR